MFDDRAVAINSNEKCHENFSFPIHFEQQHVLRYQKHFPFFFILEGCQLRFFPFLSTESNIFLCYKMIETYDSYWVNKQLMWNRMTWYESFFWSEQVNEFLHFYDSTITRDFFLQMNYWLMFQIINIYLETFKNFSDESILFT